MRVNRQPVPMKFEYVVILDGDEARLLNTALDRFKGGLALPVEAAIVRDLAEQLRALAREGS